MSLHPFPTTNNEFIHHDFLWNCYTSLDLLKRVETLQFQQKDVVLLTFPRSGTTLTQEIVWHLKHKSDNPEKEQLPHIDERFPHIEFNSAIKGHIYRLPIDLLENDDSSDRLIKTHCPVSMIQKQLDDSKCKIIFVLRNPKDTCVSLYHFYKGYSHLGPWKGDWKVFVRMFSEGYVMCGSWVKWMQSCIDYVKEKIDGGNEEDKKRILLLTYEDLVKKRQETVEKLADFLGVTLNSVEMERCLHKCKFETMARDLNQADPASGFHFVRKGEVGNWKTYCDEEDNRLLDEMAAKLNLKDLLTWSFE